MYIHLAAKIVFLAQPRTASRAIAAALLKIGFVLKQTHHDSLSDMSPYIKDPIEIDPDWIIMSAVRNHFDIFISWWFKRGHCYSYPWGVMFLKLVIGDEYLDPSREVTRRMFWKYRKESTHLIRFEDVEVNLNKILALRDLGPVSLDHIGGKKGRLHYKEYHTPETRAFIEDMFGAEMQELGYAYEEEPTGDK